MKQSELKILAIQFDRINEIFIPGDVVSGKVLVEFLKATEITALQVAVVGKSAVEWSLERDNPAANELDLNAEWKLNRRGNPSAVMTGREEYFSSKFSLFGSDSGPSSAHPAGRFFYPFKYQLPFNLPCSFEHEHGYVRYTVKASFNETSISGYSVIKNFTVISTYDLNRKLGASLAIRNDIIKGFFGSCICFGEKIYARVFVPVIGFVPGQVIPVTVHCENGSTVDVAKIKVSLRKRLKFHAKSPYWTSKLDESGVAETSCFAPFTNTFEERVTILLKVPQLPPTGLEHCGLIDVDYVLRIVVCFSGMHFSVKRRFPVLIGTVPLLGSVRPSKLNLGHPASSVVPNPSVRKPEDLRELGKAQDVEVGRASSGLCVR